MSRLEEFAKSEYAQPGIDVQVHSVLMLAATFFWPVWARARAINKKQRDQMAQRFATEMLRFSLQGVDDVQRSIQVGAIVPRPSIGGTEVSRRYHWIVILVGAPAAVKRGWSARTIKDIGNEPRCVLMSGTDFIMSLSALATNSRPTTVRRTPRDRDRPDAMYEASDWRCDHLEATPASYLICLRDAVLPVSWQTVFAGRFKASRLVRLDAGHQVMNTRPHAVAEALRHEATH